MIIAIIQARMGSTRLPGKVLKEVNKRPLLLNQLNRVKKSKLLDKIVIATSILDKDDEIVDFCNRYDIEYFRGSENDVLSRYYDCAQKYNAKTIVRLTGDCPLSDPEIIDEVINKFLNDNVDYCANTVPVETSTFPDGFDVEVFSFEALKKAYYEIKDAHFREHVTFQFWQNKEYTNTQYILKENFSEYRFTVDYPEDLELVKYIFEQIEALKIEGVLKEIVNLIDKNPSIKNINSHHFFGEGWKQ